MQIMTNHEQHLSEKKAHVPEILNAKCPIKDSYTSVYDLAESAGA